MSAYDSAYSKIANIFPYLFSLGDTYNDGFYRDKNHFSAWLQEALPTAVSYGVSNDSTVKYITVTGRSNRDNLSRCAWRKFEKNTTVGNFSESKGGGVWKIKHQDTTVKSDILTILNNMYGVKDYSWLWNRINGSDNKGTSTFHYKSQTYLNGMKVSRLFIATGTSTGTVDADYGLTRSKIDVFSFIDLGKCDSVVDSIDNDGSQANEVICFRCTRKDVENFWGRSQFGKWKLVYKNSPLTTRSSLAGKSVGTWGPSRLFLDAKYIGAYIYSRINVAKFATTFTLSECETFIRALVGKGCLSTTNMGDWYYVENYG